MKRLMIVLTIIGAVLVFGIAVGEEYSADSMLYTLDPSSAPQTVSIHRGLYGMTEEGLRGAAAGGMRENPDSLIHMLDPTNAPKAAVSVRTEIGHRYDDPDSFLYTIDPSSAPK